MGRHGRRRGPTDDDAGTDAGSVYVYRRDAGGLENWGQVAKLGASDAVPEDQFGRAVSIRQDTIGVGTAPGPGTRGAAYVFRRAAPGSDAWVELGVLAASRSAPQDGFGLSITAGLDTVVVGARHDWAPEPFAGSAFVYAVRAPGTSYCFGDGSGTACPCSNPGATGSGCANGSFAAGCRLSACGEPSVGADALVLVAASSAPGQPGLFFQGDDALGGGLPFGDGLRCAGVDVVRLEVAFADGEGAASSSVPLAATSGLSPGDLKRYQWWYRDPAGSPCGTGFNLSNGLELEWSR